MITVAIEAFIGERTRPGRGMPPASPEERTPADVAQLAEKALTEAGLIVTRVEAEVRR